jgi:hypothetical protein
MRCRVQSNEVLRLRQLLKLLMNQNLIIIILNLMIILNAKLHLGGFKKKNSNFFLTLLLPKLVGFEFSPCKNSKVKIIIIIINKKKKKKHFTYP